MSMTVVLKVSKLTGPTRVLVASRHNKREPQTRYGAAANIDAAKMTDNIALHGPPSPAEVAQLAKRLMADAGVRPLKKTAVRGIELVITLPAGSTPPEGFFRDCLPWAAESFGGVANILSADVHVDEAAPHMHILVLPLRNGRMQGSAMVGNRARFLELRESFYAGVAARHGLSRPRGRLHGPVREKTAQAVIQGLLNTGDAALSSRCWQVIRDMIEYDPGPFAEVMEIPIAIAAPKPLRTVVQTFTSKGKGPSREKPIGKQSTPIGDALPEPPKPSLSCVGVAPAGSADRDGGDEDQRQHVDEDHRHVDRSDCDFVGWTEDVDAEPVDS